MSAGLGSPADRSDGVGRRGAAIGRSVRRDVDLFRLAGARSQRELIGGLGSRAAIALGSILVLLVAIPGGQDHHPLLLGISGGCALVVGIALLRAPAAAPLPVLDVMLVAADGLLVLIGRYPGPIQSALPGIFLMIGTIVFAVRPWQVVAAHASLLGASYAGVLVIGPPQFAPVSRWIAVMVAVATCGLFVRWLVATAARFAFAEHAARELAEAAAWDLERESRAKSAFLSRMSHELRTPLNVVLGFSDLLGEQVVGPLNPRQEEYAADISASARHLVALVGDVLDVAAIESGSVVLETAPLNVRQALEAGITMVRERAAANALSITLDVPRTIGVIEADGLKVRQVVVNLLANAVKFTPRGGRIVVRARSLGDAVRVSVEDTGIGIAPEDRERIFEKFHSARSVEGTGLGLPLARQFIERHGGTLWVTSTPGRGSTFTFELPRRQPAGSQGTPAPDDVRETETDYWAFTEPGSRATRLLLSRVGVWLVLDGAALVALLGAITPFATHVRVAMLVAGTATAAVTYAARRLGERPVRSVDALTLVGIAGISVLAYYAGPFARLVPLAYCWSTMVSFALLQRLRARLYLAAVAVGYGVVLLLRSPSDSLGRWAAIVIIVAFNGQVASWVTDRLRKLLVNAQAAHRGAERVRVQLVATSRHKTSFVANMSHELRAPLNAVIGFADLLRTEAVGPLNDRQHEYLADIHAAARHLLAIINDVLDVAKLDAGQMRVSEDVVAVPALLEHAVLLANPPDTARSVRVDLDIAADIAFVVGDHHRLEQVLINLVSNAVKFTPDGGLVHVAATTAGDEIRISVSDTGVGIDESQRTRIFEPFQQGTTAPGDRLPGTGLGLALVKGLVELHGGSVAVTSEPGRGSTFTVALPRLVTVPQTRAPVTAEPDKAPG